MAKPIKHFYQFGPFRLNTAERLLLLADRPVPLEPKVFDVLVVLLEQGGHLVEKDELMRQVWPDSFVEEINLTRNISLLRKVLAQGFAEQVCIETVPKHGYRFLPSVREVRDEQTGLVVERTTTASLHIEEEETLQPEEEALVKPAGIVNEQPRQVDWKQRPVWLALGGLLVVTVLFSSSWWARQPAPPTPITQIRSIAVLPFKPLSAEGSDPYLELGVADTLITKLSNLSQLTVRPTSAIRKYTSVEQDPLAAGRDLKVEAVLEGSLQKLNDRIRVTVRLLRVSDGQPLWAHKCDEYCTDIFRMQDTVSEQVAQALVAKLTGGEKRLLAKHYTESAEAYQLYLKGRYFWNKRTTEGSRKAVEYFNRAIELDPAYALAYAGLADASLFLGGSSTETQAAWAKARAAAQQTIAIDETLAEPHASLGLIAQNVDWNWAEAEKEYKRAIELNPNYATAHHWYGEFLALMGRFDEGLAEIKRAQELDPLSLIISTDVGKVYVLARQYDRAIEQCKKTLEMDPNFGLAQVWLSLAYSTKGQHAEAIAEFHKIKGLADDPWMLSLLGYISGMAGQKVEAQKTLKRLTMISKQTYVTPDMLALVYIGLGEKDEAFKWFERTFREHGVGIVALKVAPAYDSLRSDPRFADLLRRAGFAP
jgi:DNA-binding winged helix-turn-helix (wHTH) protein/TolB-like protein/Flp pilus assembly protein TadD